MVDIPYQNPYEAPQAPVLEPPTDFSHLPVIPWEDPETYPGLWKRIGAMFSLLFSNPMELADRILLTDGLAPAWRFNLLMAVPYLAFMGVMFIFIGSITAFMPSDPNMPKGFMAGVFGGEFILIVTLLAVGMFLYGAILHAALWMWGGTREGLGLGQTVRACGYIWGFVNLGMLVPCLNLFVMLGGLVYLGMGLARIHRTDTWRGICAVLTPVFLCCLAYGLFLAFAFKMAALKH